MIILLDCDGVLADFGSAVVRGLHKKGLAKDKTSKDITDSNLAKSFGVSSKEIGDVVDTKGFCLGIDPYPGAKQFIRDLEDLGARVIIVTSPWQTSPYWVFERYKWLERLGIPSSRVIQTSAKSQVVGDALVEDREDNLNSWCEARDGKGLLVDRPYNQGASLHSNVTRVKSYEDILTWVREKAAMKKSGGQVYEGNNKKYDVEKLWDLSRRLPAQRLAVEDAQNYLGAKSWTGGMSPQEVLNSGNDEHGHMSRINAANLRYPLIMAPNQGLADGMHRLAKAKKLGKDTVGIRQFTSWDEMEPAVMEEKAAMYNAFFDELAKLRG